MVKFKIEIPEVPRKELDRLEDILDKLFYKKEENKERFEHGWESSSIEGKEGPYHCFNIQYNLSEIPYVELDAEGVTKEGNFKTIINIDIPDKIYEPIEKIISAEAPYFGKMFEKKAKIHK